MRKVEIVILVLFLIGVVMKIFQLPGSGVMLGLSLSVLSMIYFGFSWLIFKPAEGKNVVAFSILSGLIYSILCSGVLFKIQIYEGASIILNVGITALVLVLLPIVFWGYRKGSTKSYFAPHLKRILVIGSIALIIYSIPTNSSVRFYHRDDPDYAEKLINVLENPMDPKAQQEFEEARKRKYEE